VDSGGRGAQGDREPRYPHNGCAAYAPPTGRGLGGLRVHTSEAAKALGISARSLARWAAEGRITPDLVTPGGHMRWDVESLRSQLRQLRNSDGG
jgi:hypothetical protein